MKYLSLTLLLVLSGCGTFGFDDSPTERCYLASAMATSSIEEAAELIRTAPEDLLSPEERYKARLAMVSLDAALDASAPICLMGDVEADKINAAIDSVVAARYALLAILPMLGAE